MVADLLILRPGWVRMRPLDSRLPKYNQQVAIVEPNDVWKRTKVMAALVDSHVVQSHSYPRTSRRPQKCPVGRNMIVVARTS